ncbi:MAG: hypothetical protein ChlgKO_12020 [Chlamydiales bacterium]
MSIVYPPGTSPVDVEMWKDSEKRKSPENSQKIDAIAKQCLEEMEGMEEMQKEVKRIVDEIYKDASVDDSLSAKHEGSTIGGIGRIFHRTDLKFER